MIKLWIALFAVQFTWHSSLRAQTAPAYSRVLLVVNKEDHSVSVLDPAGKKEIKRIPVGQSPHELTASADGRLAYVANYGLPGYGNSISVIDIKAGREIRRISTGSLYRPHCIKLQGDRLYFTSEVTRIIAGYNISKDSIDFIAGIGQDGAHMLVVTPDGSKIFTANRVSHTVTAITVGSRSWAEDMQQIQVGKRPEGIDISPDGKKLWVGNTDEGSIDIIESATGKISARIRVGRVPIRIQCTPDGRKVLVSDSGTNEVYVLDAVFGKLLHTIPAPGAPMGLQISPDSKTAYICCSSAAEVKILDLTSMQFTGSIKTGKAPDGICWGSLE